MLLKNGHVSYRDKRSIQTFNTCPFDSFFVVVAAMYADHDEIRNQINLLAPKSEFLSMITGMFNDVGKIAVKHNALLRQRNVILNSIFPGEEFECSLVAVDCRTNANYIIPKLLPSEMASYTREKLCDRCGEPVLSIRFFVDINMEEYETVCNRASSCYLYAKFLRKSIFWESVSLSKPVLNLLVQIMRILLATMFLMFIDETDNGKCMTIRNHRFCAQTPK